MQPTLAVIDIDIRAGQDEIAREGLLEHLSNSHDQCITPLGSGCAKRHRPACGVPG
jgi:hypothetical protein